MDEPAPFYTPGIGSNFLGGKCAAPVFSEVARRSLEYLGIVKDDPHGFPRGDPRYDPEKTDWNQERTDLKQLYDEWNA
jgi:cell division protein FtsI (penicillin-binding protein 3)